MRGGGGNITTSHGEDVSLCALFLMEASKKVDREFQCNSQQPILLEMTAGTSKS